MIEIKSTGCCAMKEIDNLSHATTAEEAMVVVGPYLLAERREIPFMLFSGVTNRYQSDHASSRLDNYGQAFEHYIRDHKLGTTTKSGEQRNPRTGNGVTVWIWEPNFMNLRIHTAALLEKRRIGNAVS